MSVVKTLFLNTRPRHLLLALVLAGLGITMAMSTGPVKPFHAILCVAGMLLLHLGTPPFNKMVGSITGKGTPVDRTPFSLGSGLIVRYGHGIAETAGALLLGTLPVFGIHWILTGSHSLSAMMMSVPSGLLLFNLLLLNEFADIEADDVAGRKTLLLTMGDERVIRLYRIILIILYLWIAGCVVARIMPVYCLMVLCTLPLARQAVRFIRQDNATSLLKALAANIGITLSVNALLCAGFLLDILLGP